LKAAALKAASTGPRLLVVSSYYDSHKGGLELVAGRLAAELAHRGLPVTWLATAATEPPKDPAIRPVPVGAWNITERRAGIPFPLPGLGALARLWREAGHADAILLHDSLYPLSMAATVAARLRRKPLVIIQHIGAVRYRHPLPRTLMALANRIVARPVLGAADQVVFISHFVRDFFAGVRFRAAPEIIFNGVDTEVFKPGDRAAARRHLDLPTKAKVVLFVGRFVEKKGLHLLERAARARPDLIFAFAGWGHLDPKGWRLANVRVFEGLSGSSLAELYRAADLFALPSVGEGFPLVVQEALASGLPVICGAESTTADPAAAAYLTGVDVECGDDIAEGALLDAIDQALSERQTAQTRQNTHRFVHERYSWATGADRYEAILRSLTARPSMASENPVQALGQLL
jgi:glycosyltransferase involved in cell wall biosynthesis